MSVFKPVWDLPTRAFHWLLAVNLLISWWTIENDLYEWHEKSGMVMICLLVFRLLWGFFGSETARFGHFLKTPDKAWRDMRDFWEFERRDQVGHKALGGYAVVVLLTVLAAQAGMGLMSRAEYVLDGPWVILVGEALSDTITGWHAWLFNVIIGLVLLHLAAVSAYVVLQGNDILTPMITGRKETAHQPHMVDLRRAGIVIVAAFVIGWGGVGLVETIAGA